MAPPKGSVPWNKGISQWEYQKHPMLGKHHSEETLEKMRQNHWSKRGHKSWNKGKTIVDRIQKICPICGNLFLVPPHKGRQTFCSVRCRNKIPWNKGIKCPQLSKALKGRTVWNKGLNKEIDSRVTLYTEKLRGIKKPSLVGENNPSRRPDVIEKLRILNLGKKNPQCGKKLAKEHKKKLLDGIKKARKDEKKNELWNTRVSISLKGKQKSEEHIQKLRIATLNKEIHFPQKDTSIEMKLKEELNKRSMLKHFEEHSVIKNICRPDLVSHKFRLAVFCDGDFWHTNPIFFNGKSLTKIQERNLKKDKRQNELLEKNGWIVLRFWESDINENVSKCVDGINEKIKRDIGVRE